MRTRRWIWATVAGLALMALSGCTSPDENGTEPPQGADGETPDDDPGGPPADGGPPNGTGDPAGGPNGTGAPNGTGNQTGGPNGTGNQTGGPNGTGNQTSPPAWRYDNRTGTISGNGLFISGPSDEEELFEVANGTHELWLNLSVDGDDLEMEVRPPGCGDSDCGQSVDVSDGMAAHHVEAPENGTWTVVLDPDAGIGPYRADYTLQSAALVPTG